MFSSNVSCCVQCFQYDFNVFSFVINPLFSVITIVMFIILLDFYFFSKIKFVQIVDDNILNTLFTI